MHMLYYTHGTVGFLKLKEPTEDDSFSMTAALTIVLAGPSFRVSGKS